MNGPQIAALAGLATGAILVWDFFRRHPHGNVEGEHQGAEATRIAVLGLIVPGAIGFLGAFATASNPDLWIFPAWGGAHVVSAIVSAGIGVARN